MSVGTESLCWPWLQADDGNVVRHTRDIRPIRPNNTRRNAHRASLTGPVALSAKFDIARLTFPSEIPAKSYFVGTLNCVRCNHGIVYPPSPILKIPHLYQYPVYDFPCVGNKSGKNTHVTVVAANTSRCPTGIIPSEIKAPFVRSTLPNIPLFAAPFAGTVKPVKDWSK